tara:strand:- start:269 stop:460 length:192 start_codon:yes stop_codon:yes gene_type:complete
MEKYRWYRDKRRRTHSRKESWFSSTEREKVYEENFIRIKGMDDLTPFVKPKPKAKSNAKKKKK